MRDICTLSPLTHEAEKSATSAQLFFFLFFHDLLPLKTSCFPFPLGYPLLS
jgi:hypothetical protein